MKFPALLCLLVVTWTSPALAQLRSSDQFYANADGAYAWTADSKKKMRTTNWFAKNPVAIEQKVRQAIEKYKFPPDGELPRVEKMFEPLPDSQRGNRQKLQLPPPTLQFPRLEHSTWETSSCRPIAF